MHDIAIVGAGPAGLTAAIRAAAGGCAVHVFEKLPRPSLKLLASGGGRCNLTNTDELACFMERFGRQGRFMQDALRNFGNTALREWLAELGVETHAPDGKHVFPVSHSAQDVVDALLNRCAGLGVRISLGCEVTGLLLEDHVVVGLEGAGFSVRADRVILACGGQGYAALGGGTGGYALARQAGHSIVCPVPAMVPLVTEPVWPECRAHTIGHVTARIPLKEARRIQESGDLIFTRDGLRGPLVQDLSRHVTPLLTKHARVPLLLNLTGETDSNGWTQRLAKWRKEYGHCPVVDFVSTVLPADVAVALCLHAGVDPQARFSQLAGKDRVLLLDYLAWTPFDVTGTEGWEKAMVTRGGIALKEVDPKTMQSRLIQHLAIAGELLDLDGPCGGYNLQWAFSSGRLAGAQAAAQIFVD